MKKIESQTDLQRENPVLRRVAVGGLGLGLYIAKQIMRAHGGRILLDSTPGRGARFTLELPSGRPPESAPLESAQVFPA